MLKLTSVETFYGNIQALKGINLEVFEGEIKEEIPAKNMRTKD